MYDRSLFAGLKLDALLANSAKTDTAGARSARGVEVYESRIRFLKTSDFREEKFPSNRGARPERSVPSQEHVNMRSKSPLGRRAQHPHHRAYSTRTTASFVFWARKVGVRASAKVCKGYSRLFPRVVDFRPWVVSGRITSTHTKCVARGNYFECNIRRSSRF